MKTSCIAPPQQELNLVTECSSTLLVSIFHFTGKQKTNSSRLHSHSFFKLFFIEDGEGWYRVGKHKIWAKPGDLFVIAPDEVHDLSGLDNASKWIVAFKVDFLVPSRTDTDLFLKLPNELLVLSFLRSPSIKTRHVWIAPEERPQWLLQMKQLQSELRDKRLAFIEATRALLMLLLIDAARLAPDESRRCSAQFQPLLTKVFQFIDTNYRHPIGLHEVAKEVNLSSAYLTDLVRRETGRTVLNWIVERRIAEARCLLLETDRSVNQIAEAVGYLDTGYFIRLFRRSHGKTPQVWRLLHRN